MQRLSFNHKNTESIMADVVVVLSSCKQRIKIQYLPKQDSVRVVSPYLGVA
jgi:hypothetical protein